MREYESSVDMRDRRDNVSASMSTCPNSSLCLRGLAVRRCHSLWILSKSRPPKVCNSGANGTYSILRRDGCRMVRVIVGTAGSAEARGATDWCLRMNTQQHAYDELGLTARESDTSDPPARSVNDIRGKNTLNTHLSSAWRASDPTLLPPESSASGSPGHGRGHRTRSQGLQAWWGRHRAASWA